VSVSPIVWFIIRRLGVTVVLLLVLSVAIFGLVYLAPGNIVDSLLGLRPRTPQLVAQLNHYYHLDKPFFTQYWYWINHAFHGDLGRSADTGFPVTSSIAQRAGVTIYLAVYAFVLTMSVGTALGVLAALKQRSVIDRTAVGFSMLAGSAPAFVSGILFLWVFTVHWKLMPSFGPGAGFGDRFVHLTLPAIAFAIPAAGGIMKLVRASMIQALDQDYIAFARARGVPARTLIFSYALRNACIPVVTASAYLLSALLVGAIFVEAVFSLPGLGQLMITAVAARDVPLIQGLALLASAVVIVANLLVDVLYPIIDPRIRFGAIAA
jgi:peptide/nickel transport system permease protein